MAQKHIRATLEDISTSVMTWQWESGRRFDLRELQEADETNSGNERYWYAGTETGDTCVSE